MRIYFTLIILLFSSSVYSIVNGSKVKFGEIESRFVVSWAYRGDHFCSGVLINKRYVITAAHCVSGGLDHIAFGNIITPKTAYFIPVEKAFVHPEFNAGWLVYKNPPSFVNDIAVLKLKWNAPAFTSPAILLNEYSSLPWEKNLFISGFGKESLFGKDGELIKGKTKLNETLNWSEELVVKGDSSPCGGDSGGPLYFFDLNRKPVVVGITSRHDKRDLKENCSGASLFTDIRYYHQWIRQVILTSGKTFDLN